jgi:ribosomal protein S18 acetylase RimI-like enzyme
MPDVDFAIRRAQRHDLPALGRLGALLLRTHHGFDHQRFMAPGDRPEQGYAWFLGTQLEREDAVILVVEREGRVLGYAYASIEPQSWKELRAEAGFVHDVIVDPEARGGGMGRALVDAAVRWLAGRGMPRVVLWTASRNEDAQRLFSRLGFRPTMIEMTREMA